MLSHNKLRSVRRMTLYEQVFEEIRHYITQNQLEPGDRLPTEREMAETLKVSRHSVREALKSLEFMGVVSSQPKNGYVMQPFTMRFIADQIMFRYPRTVEQILQIVQCRRVLELSSLDLALANGQPHDLARMERHLDAAGEALHDPEAFEEHCARFHDALFAATGNDLLRGWFEVVAEFFRRASVYIPIGPVDGRVAAYEARRVLYGALSAQQPEAARRAVVEYTAYYERPEVVEAVAKAMLIAPESAEG